MIRLAEHFEYDNFADKRLFKSRISRLPFQFVVFRPLSCCFEETIGFDVKISFARPPVLRLIKPGNISKEF